MGSLSDWSRTTSKVWKSIPKKKEMFNDDSTYVSNRYGFIVGILIAMGCGSQSPKTPHQARDGRLFVWNDCTSLVTIKVIKVNDESTVLVEGVDVAPGERKEVVEIVLEGGTELRVNVRGKAERSNDVTERDLPVEIDGITTLHITGIQPGAVIHEVIYG